MSGTKSVTQVSVYYYLSSIFSCYLIFDRRTVFQYEDDHVGKYTVPMSTAVAAKVKKFLRIFLLTTI